MNNLLLENNQSHSRKLFLGCLFIALVLAPLVLYFVGRSMDKLHPNEKHGKAAQDSNSATWDFRSM